MSGTEREVVNVRVLIPFEGVDVPEGVSVEVFTGGTPARLDDVELYVPPYTLKPGDLSFLERMPRLQVLQTLTAGYEHVLPYLPDGVTLCNAGGVHDASTAELAVALALASLRGIPAFTRAQDRGEWRSGFHPALADKTVLIVGYGSIGKAVERRLAGFEVDVLRLARHAREGVSAVGDLPNLLPRADVVVLTVPLTDETYHLVDGAFLDRMREGALLVNVARGKVVDTDALLAALRAGRVTAGLDVTDPEPLPPDHPLWGAPGCLISPHVGGPTSAFEPRARGLVADQIARFVRGEPLRNVVGASAAAAH
ncbi:MAG: 2-hydroxyacid dehydrogenase [Streptosporangiales bacterium]